MNRRRLLVGLLTVFCFVQGSYSGPEDIYKQNKHSLKVGERLALIHQIVVSSTDSAILDQAMEEYLRFSWKEEKVNPALEAIDARIAKAGSVTDVKMALTKARLLARVGKTAEADAIFQEGMDKKWDKAWENYYQSLCDRKDFVTLTSKIFRDTFNPECRTKKDLAYFAENLLKFKLNNPNLRAQERILPLITDDSRYPHAKEIAQALCRLTDWEFEEGIKQLLDVKKSLEERKAAGSALAEIDSYYEEDKHIDLYLCLGYLMEGRDYSAARTALQEFYNKNIGDTQYFYNKALWLTYQFQQGENMPPKILEITSFLVDSDLVKNEEVKAQLSEENLAHLWNKHHMGLKFAGRYDEAMEVCKYAADTYFPQTSSGTHSAVAWANHLAGMGKLSEAEAYFEKILAENQDDYITPQAKLCLARIKRNLRKLPEALSLTAEAMAAMEGSEELHYKFYYEQAKAFENEILQDLTQKGALK